MKAFIQKILKFLASLVTDRDWDGDAAKFVGIVLIAAGVAGFFYSKPDFQWVIITGAGMVGTGKWAEERAAGSLGK
jgi:hypothetical protein